MSVHPAISRSVLSDQVKDRLLQAILAGRYPPGSRIVETLVARELGTSQAPVREALRDLEALGLIQIEPFRGARVRLPTTDELLEAFAVRSELESLGARLAVGRIRETDIGHLQADLREMSRAADAADAPAQAAADARFHARIVDLSGNRTLGRVWRYLEPFSRTYITVVSPGADLHRIAALHVDVHEALRLRDSDRVTLAIERHFLEAAEMLRQLWREEPPNAGPRPVRLRSSRRLARTGSRGS